MKIVGQSDRPITSLSFHTDILSAANTVVKAREMVRANNCWVFSIMEEQDEKGGSSDCDKETEYVCSIAKELRRAEETGFPVSPVADRINHSLECAYRVQEQNVAHWVSRDRRQVGWKIGLTAESARQQLQATEPTYGAIFADMEIIARENLSIAPLIQPKIEPELAIVLKSDISEPNPGSFELMQAIDFVLPAFEVVDCRIRDWEISAVDAIADNGVASRFILGTQPFSLHKFDLGSYGVAISRNEKSVGNGSGAICLGHPLNALHWLSKRLHENERHLRCGQIVLTGSLCPMIDIAVSDTIEAHFNGVHSLTVRVSR